SIFVNGNNQNNPAQAALLTGAAQELGIEVQSIEMRRPADVGPAMAKAMAWRPQGFFNGIDSFINSQRFALAKLAAQNTVPAIYPGGESALAGGLMSLGGGPRAGYYRAAGYVHKIPRGANPADLPIALPTELIFTVNRSALKDMGLTLPEEIAARVTEW